MSKTKLKLCSKCGIVKDVEEFYKDSQKPDGLYPSCKACKYNKGSKEKIIIMTLKEKILNELKQNEKTNLKELQNKFGKTTHLELIELVNDRKIGSTISINDGQTYYIK